MIQRTGLTVTQRFFYDRVLPLCLLLLGLLLFGSAINLQGQEVDVAGLEEQAIGAAVARVAPSVVRIETVGGLDRIGNFLLGDGPTTGLAVHKDGYIVSSAFNFVRKPSSILVTLPSGKRSSATIVARDHSRMLVLLKVDADEDLTVPDAIPSDDVQVGQWAIAVGRTFDPLHPNMSVGIISAKDRVWGKAVQCDAKISPSNYGGPLVDIEGRVFGVLVPMSPNATSEVSGAEWYDSGIGFAVPLADINRMLPTLMKGEDIHAGLMGIALKGGSIYSSPAELAACQVKSPAHEAGLRAGDTIIEIDGRPIQRQSHLKHALGTKYAGEVVHVVARRDDEKIEADITLVDHLVPYDRPFLGVLPKRDEQKLIVRYVLSGSTAAEGGIKVGDQITQLNDEKIEGVVSLRDLVANLEPGNEVKLTVARAEKTETFDVTLSSLPTKLPTSVPPSRSVSTDEDKQTKLIEITVPEQPNKCFALIPRGYQPDVSHGVVVYLRPPGELDKDKMLDRWREVCESRDLILLAPQPLDSNRWTPIEVDFVKKTLDQIIANYNIDRTRIVTYGKEAGGALGYLFAFRNRELVRAVVAVDATMPTRLRPPATDPVYPLAILTTTCKKSRIAERVEQAIEQLREMKYPVSTISLEATRELNASELQSVSRWIDTLDRI